MLRARAKGFQCLCPQARHRSPRNTIHTRPFTGRPQSVLEPTSNTLVPLDPSCASEPRQKSRLQIHVYLGNKHLRGCRTIVHGLVKAMQAVSSTWLVSFLLGVLHFLVSAGSLFYSLSVKP